MKQTRKDFFKTSGIIAAGSIAASIPASSFATNIIKDKGSKMKLTFKPYTLELKHVFTVAVYSRTTTPVMLTKIEYEGIKGYGEASMPPYLGESQESATAFLSKVNLEQFNDPFEMEKILDYVDSVDQKNTAAKASLDIALHDLIGKLLHQPWYKIWGYDKTKTPNTTFTIGIDTAEVVKQKVKEAAEFKVLKVKLGKDNDKEMIETIRSVTNVPLTIDVNQGWKDKHFALEMINWLKLSLIPSALPYFLINAILKYECCALIFSLKSSVMLNGKSLSQSPDSFDNLRICSSFEHDKTFGCKAMPMSCK